MEMKKAFVWDPSMRSSAIKYDPCISVENGKNKIKCNDCKITLISDRFLGREFQQNVLGELGCSKGKYPYVIIADTLGCNLRCWFCYAYKFITTSEEEAKENGCEVAYVSPKRLAEQFGCKIEKLSDFNQLLNIINNKGLSEKYKEEALKHLKMKLPLMRLRISGGEPIFSTPSTLLNPVCQTYIRSTVFYWLNFFEELDKIVENLKSKGSLNVIDKESVRVMKREVERLPFPTCIAERNGRLNIRFDTNGIIYAIENITHIFIEGLFDLFKNGKLNNIYIEFDFSFKGSTPIEYQWSQKNYLPIDRDKISFDYELEEHPQIRGYSNIVNTIRKCCNDINDFNNCVGITVERGINHHLSHKVYVYFKEALNWDKFSEKAKRANLDIKFSQVDNPIDIFNWRNWRPKFYLFDNGANLVIVSNNQKLFDLEENSDLDEFIRRFRKFKNESYLIIYPTRNKIKLEKSKRICSAKITSKVNKISGWVFSGNRENWIVAINNKKWGVKKGNIQLWRQIKPNDIVLFYVTRPISKIAGYALVEKIVEENDPIWPDEIREKKTKYPLRIILRDLKYLPEYDWHKGLDRSDLPIEHGINPVYDKDKIESYCSDLYALVEDNIK